MRHYLGLLGSQYAHLLCTAPAGLLLWKQLSSSSHLFFDDVIRAFTDINAPLSACSLFCQLIALSLLLWSRDVQCRYKLLNSVSSPLKMPLLTAQNELNSESLRVRKAKEIWRGATAVCFDVDSTLIQEEGLDSFAQYCGKGPQVIEWTKKAMGGSVTFQESLKARLDIIQPSLQTLLDFCQQISPDDLLTPGIEALVSLLLSKGTTVYLVSGGFRRLIEPLAEFLGIPKENVFANRMFFDKEGQYTGFDEQEPTSCSGGKPRVMEMLKQKHETIVMIGDGATDLEAYPPADTFIGFGGNVVREKVKAGAPWFIYDIQELTSELEHPGKGQRISEQQQQRRRRPPYQQASAAAATAVQWQASQ